MLPEDTKVKVVMHWEDSRLREVEDQLRNIRGEIDEQRRRIDRLEEIFLRKPEKEKSPHFPEAVTVPLVTTPVATWEDKL